MAQIQMQIEKRTDIGSNKVKKLRSQDLIPGVLYSRGKETIQVAVNKPEFIRVFRRAGSTSLLGLELDGEVIPAIMKDIQRHPYKEEVLHIDFQELDMAVKIRITIPIVLLHRDDIKAQPSVLMQQIDEIDIECLPGDIPNTAEVDVRDLELFSSITIADLDIAEDENIEILEDLDTVVCTLTEPSYDEEEEEALLDELLDDEMLEPELIGEDEDESEEEVEIEEEEEE